MHDILRVVTRADALQGLVPVPGPASAKRVQSVNLPRLEETAVSYVPMESSRIKNPQLRASFAHLVAGRTKRQAQWMNASLAEPDMP